MSEPAKPRGIAVDVALMVVGLVVFVPSGLCAGVLGGFAVLSDWWNGNPVDKQVWGLSQMSLTFAAPFMAGGATLIGLGLFHLRRR